MATTREILEQTVAEMQAFADQCGAKQRMGDDDRERLDGYGEKGAGNVAKDRIAPDYRFGVFPWLRDAHRVLDLIPKDVTEAPSVHYFRALAAAGAAATVAQGAIRDVPAVDDLLPCRPGRGRGLWCCVRHGSASRTAERFDPRCKG